MRRIAIVGSGYSALGAAKVLSSNGYSLSIFEAKDRVGGRAYTDEANFSYPWDQGCFWYHSSSVNPLRVLADINGFGYVSEDRIEKKLFINGRFYDQESEIFRQKVRFREANFHQAILDLSNDCDRNRAFSDVVGTSEIAHDNLAKTWLSFLQAELLENFCLGDYLDYSGISGDLPSLQGYGKLLVSLFEPLMSSVYLNTPVTKIDYSNSSGGIFLTVEDRQALGMSGNVEGKEKKHGPFDQVIVTVSMGVLQSSIIGFEPVLSETHKRMISCFNPGYAEKFAVELEPSCLESFNFSYLSYLSGQGIPLNFVIKPFGRPMVIASISKFLAELYDFDNFSIKNFVYQSISEILGVEVVRLRQDLAKADCFTDWSGDKYIASAYASVKPNLGISGDEIRGFMRRGIRDKVFFAGEALHPEFFTTAHGAFDTGMMAARSIIDVSI